MLFKGNRRFGAQEIWSLAEGAGGFLNGFTERDTLCIHAHVPESEWQNALNLLFHMAFTSTFPIYEFEKERNIVAAEILQTQDDIEERLLDDFFIQLWQGQPASFPIAGSLRDIKALTRENVMEFYQHVFMPQNAIIAVSGPIPDSKIIRFLERILTEFSTTFDSAHGTKTYTLDVAPKPHAGRIYKKTKSSQQFHIEAFQLGRPFSGFDYYSLALVSNLIGESSSSRLFKKIREEEGLAYTISSNLYHSRTEALILIISAFETENTARVLSLINDELKKLFSEPLIEKELDDHRMRLAGSFQIMLEDPEFRTRRMARNFIDSRQVLDEKEELEKYLSVDIQQVKTVLMMLNQAPSIQFLYGPLEKRKAEDLGFLNSKTRREIHAKDECIHSCTPQ